MKVLITGASGYVGRNLLNIIDKNIYDVYAVVRKYNDDFPANIKQILTDENFEDNIQAASSHVVLHLAAFLTARSEKEDIDKLIEANISFGSKLLNALKKTELKYFINIGSFSEYHYNDGVLLPTYFYAATKTAFRYILKYFSEVKKFNILHIVPFSIYGGKDTQKKIMDILFDALTANEPLKLSEGKQYLDFIHLNDVLDFFILLLKNLDKVKNDETLFLGTGKPHNLKELAGIIADETGHLPKIQWGALPPRERDTPYAVASISKLQETFNWQPQISLKQGVKLKSNEFFNRV